MTAVRRGLEVGLVLTLVALGFSFLAGPPAGEMSTALRLLEGATAALGSLLPFAAFAAGLRHWGDGVSRAPVVGLLVAALTLGLASYGLTAWGAPLAEHAVDVESGVDVSSARPFGAATTAGLIRHRATLLENPPTPVRLSTSDPTAWPRSWVDFLIASPIVFALFGFLNVLIGFRVAEVTADQGADARYLTRWAVALIGGMGFLAAAGLGSAWLRANLDASGFLAAGVPLSIPVLQLAVLTLLGGSDESRDEGPNESPIR